MFPHSHHLTGKREITLDLMEWIQTAVKDSGAVGGNSRYRKSSADAENARGEGLIPGSERSPAGGNGY